MTLQKKAIALVAQRIRNDQNRYSASEANTRKDLINPILDAYGWNLANPSQVRSEQGTANPGRADLTLIDPERRAPIAQLEAKKLGSPDMTKAVLQIAQYNDGGGRTNRLNIITDGDKWVFRRPGSSDAEKPLAEVQITQDHPNDSASTLTKLLRPQRIRTGQMDQVLNTMDAGAGSAPALESNVYISLDLETTGFSNKYDRIIEFGAVKFRDGKEIDSMRTLVNPGRNIPDAVQELTGITNADVSTAPRWGQVRRQVDQFIQGHPIIAHNAAFDQRMLNAHGITTSHKWYDTMKLSRRVYPDQPSHSLENITLKLGIHQPGTHRADVDARLTARAFTMLMARANAMTPDKRASLIRETHRRSQTPESRLLQAAGKQPVRQFTPNQTPARGNRPSHSRSKSPIKTK